MDRLIGKKVKSAYFNWKGEIISVDCYGINVMTNEGLKTSLVDSQLEFIEETEAKPLTKKELIQQCKQLMEEVRKDSIKKELYIKEALEKNINCCNYKKSKAVKFTVPTTLKREELQQLYNLLITIV